jgi:hypothetical protein
MVCLICKKGVLGGTVGVLVRSHPVYKYCIPKMRTMSIYVSCEDSTLVMILLFTVCLKIYFVASISVCLDLSLLIQFMWMVTWLVEHILTSTIFCLFFFWEPLIQLLIVIRTHTKKAFICHITPYTQDHFRMLDAQCSSLRICYQFPGLTIFFFGLVSRD